MAIVRRTCLKEALTVSALILCGFFFLYILIDYSIRAKMFSQAHASFLHITLYYCRELAKRLPLLLPCALMLGTIKVLTRMNLSREWVALLSGGLSPRSLIRPFLFLGYAGTLLLFACYQWVIPYTESTFHRIEQQALVQLAPPSIHALQLPSPQLLVYKSYDSNTQVFSDLFWINSPQDMYRIESFDAVSMIGFHVDHLQKQEGGELLLTASFKELSLPQLKIEEQQLNEAAHVPAMHDSLSHLWGRLSFSWDPQIEEEAKITAAFFYKIVTPFIALFALLIPIPYCLRYGRQFPLFFLYALSLFGYIIMTTLVDGALILAQHRLMPPILAFFIPILLFSVPALISYRYITSHRA